MLKRRGIPGTVYLGVMKDENRPVTLAAHAWVRCGSIILTGAPVPQPLYGHFHVFLNNVIELDFE